jgi:hypothetical protein
MSDEAKKYIQNSAWKRFPAQELWIDPNDNFWAFDIESDQVTFTNGVYKNNNILFKCIVHPTNNGEDYVQSYIEEKRSEGFECFAIQMHN